MNTDKYHQLKRLIWIDDEYPNFPWLLKTLKTFVGEENLITARTTSTAEKYLELDSVFHCVLIDIMLPRNDRELNDLQVRLNEGIVLLEKMKNGHFPSLPLNTPIIVYTARGNGNANDQIITLLDPTNDILLHKSSDPIDDVIFHVKRALNL